MRSQLTSIRYSNSAGPLFGLIYYYQNNSSLCPTGNSTGNNGQIQCISDFVQPGRSSAYTYDPLGRLSTAKTTGGGSYPAWGLSETYDRYGNRTAQSVTAGSGPNSTLTINAANNQISGYTYDAAGNVIQEPLTQSTTWTYDGEECNTSFSGIGGAATYTCDGNELRVKKVVTGSNAVTTVSVRSRGQVLAEYDNGAAAASPTREYLYGNNLLAIVTGSSGGSGGTIVYQQRDHISPRLYTDLNGNDVGEQGTFPFGEPWYNNSATSSWVFTTYERDAESGNDYALARSYANSSGRFLAPDPLEGRVGDPQSWNRYAYVENDPVNLSDPSGQGFWSDFANFFESLFESAGAAAASLENRGDGNIGGNNGLPEVGYDILTGAAISLRGATGSFGPSGLASYSWDFFGTLTLFPLPICDCNPSGWGGTNDSGGEVGSIGRAVFGPQMSGAWRALEGDILKQAGAMYAGGFIGGAAGHLTGEFVAGLQEGLSGAAEQVSATEPGLYLAGKAPMQVTPGTPTLTGEYINDLGRIEPWTAHYDEYGRVVGRTDYNARNIAEGIPEVHYHEYAWRPGGLPVEILKHVPGEYFP